ncbi:formyltransferase family protein [Croceivirga thetidis]|uniref:Formyl transferase N-terminal domain-containing protein n=1 Tax=Croceivirga thetidis TaxID=2721623 RepID=A0ABX1GQ26_9FLAO|nr:formyltransferase family protein [Croceivirga thetidis]NKI32012.1 hypothetical protein [Croceivirga thetidis]
MNKVKTDFSISIFAGDNLFTFLSMSQVLKTLDIDRIFISNFNQDSKKIKKIYAKTSLQYFIYRSFVQVISIFFRNISIKNFAKKNGIPVEFVSTKKDILGISKSKPDLALAANFDMIIPTDFINSLKFGIMNVHAADLPKDKGISPVVWAFCRGDEEIFISFYMMDGGIDTGPIIKKEKIIINKKWSLFRTYCEVLLRASQVIPELIKSKSFQNLSENNVESTDTPEIMESYNSWPNKELHRIMRRTGRSYFKLSDLSFLIRTKNQL